MASKIFLFLFPILHIFFAVLLHPFLNKTIQISIVLLLATNTTVVNTEIAVCDFIAISTYINCTIKVIRLHLKKSYYNSCFFHQNNYRIPSKHHHPNQILLNEKLFLTRPYFISYSPCVTVLLSYRIILSHTIYFVYKIFHQPGINSLNFVISPCQPTFL